MASPQTYAPTSDFWGRNEERQRWRANGEGAEDWFRLLRTHSVPSAEAPSPFAVPSQAVVMEESKIILSVLDPDGRLRGGASILS